MAGRRRRVRNAWVLASLLAVLAGVGPVPAAAGAPDPTTEQTDRAARLGAREATRTTRAVVPTDTTTRTTRAVVPTDTTTRTTRAVVPSDTTTQVSPPAAAVAAAAPTVSIDKFVSPIPQFQGQLVTVGVTITNTSAVPITVTAVTDSDLNSGATTSVCSGLVGVVLQPGESRTCTIFVGPAELDHRDRARVTVAAGGIPASAEDTVHWNLNSEGIPPKLSVVKTNDANGDGVFNDMETAGAPGNAVEFHVVVKNVGVTPISITGLTDEFPPTLAPFGVCPELVGMQLIPNQSVSCSFTIPGYAPLPGSSLVDVVRVRGQLFGLTLEASDPSTVNTKLQPLVEIPRVTLPPLVVTTEPPIVVATPIAVPPVPPVPPEPPEPPEPQPTFRAAQLETLAFTGPHTAALSAVAAVVLAVGLALLRVSRYLPPRSIGPPSPRF